MLFDDSEKLLLVSLYKSDVGLISAFEMLLDLFIESVKQPAAETNSSGFKPCWFFKNSFGPSTGSWRDKRQITKAVPMAVAPAPLLCSGLGTKSRGKTKKTPETITKLPTYHSTTS